MFLPTTFSFRIEKLNVYSKVYTLSILILIVIFIKLVIVLALTVVFIIVVHKIFFSILKIFFLSISFAGGGRPDFSFPRVDLS